MEALPGHGLCGQDVVLQELRELWKKLPETKRPSAAALTEDLDFVRSMEGVDAKMDAIFTKIQAQWTRHNPLRVMKFSAVASMDHLMKRVMEQAEDLMLPLQVDADAASRHDDLEHERLCLQVVLAMQMKVLHSVLVTSLYLLPSWQRHLSDPKSHSRAFYRRHAGINMLKRLRETQALGNWNDQKASAFVASYFCDTFGLNRKEFVIAFSTSLQKFIKLTLSSKVMTPSLEKQLLGMPASVLCKLPELVMENPLPWTPLMQETMVATLDILPALTLKNCANAHEPSVDTFREKALYVGRQLLTPLMMTQHSAIYSSGKINVPFASYQFQLKVQEDLLTSTSYEALLEESVHSLASAFFPLVSDPRILPGVAPVLQKPEFELLVRTRLPLTIDLTLRLLRIGLKAIETEGKIFVPTLCGRSHSRDWNKIYVSLSGKVSARTVLEQTSWYLSTVLTLGAIFGQIAVTFAAPPDALAAAPWIAGIVLTSQIFKIPRILMIVVSGITKWLRKEKPSPYSFKWDPSESLMTYEGDIRYYLSSWTKESELQTAWLGANTGAAFFSLIAPLAIVPSLADMEPEGLAHLDALMYPPKTRAKIIKKLTAMHKVMNNLADRSASGIQADEQHIAKKVRPGDLIETATEIYDTYSELSDAHETISTAVSGGSVLWDQDSSSVEVGKYLAEAAQEVDDANDILPLLQGAIERLPDSELTDLLESTVQCSDLSAALETLCHGLAEEIAESFYEYAEYAVDLASWIADVAVQAWI